MSSHVAGRSQRRKSSRTNSTSSSVVTVKKAASVSSRSGSRTPHSATRPRSPDELGPQITALLQSSFDPSAKGRRSSSWSRPGSSSGIREGVGNLNRWSQSTTSSASGQESGLARRRKNSVSRHMSIGPLSMLGPDAPERLQSADAGDGRPSSRRPPGEKLRRRDGPVLPALDPNLRFTPVGELRAASSTSNPFETPSSGSVTPLTVELLAPSTAPTDYFGEQWSSQHRAPSNGPRSTARPPKIPESPKVPRSFQRSPQTPIDLATKPMPPLPPESSSSDADASDRVWRAGHARSQGQDGTGSGDTEVGSLLSSTGSERYPQQYHRSPVQKTMLSQALSRANSAVVLDNAKDVRGAIEAYEDACQLLREVMLRSSGNDDRSKLQAIRTTYASRIVELIELEQAVVGSRRGPAPVDLSSDHGASPNNGIEYEDEIDLANRSAPQPSLSPADLPPRHQSLRPVSSDKMIENIQSALHQPPIIAAYYPTQREIKTSFLTVQDSMRPEYMPPPLSPRRPLSPSSERQARPGPAFGPVHVASQLVHHTRDPSTESTSWLNTVDESGGSSASSLHSRTSPRDHATASVKDSAGHTEVDFDLALDAAVDAAYEEPQGESNEPDGSTYDDIMSAARRNVAMKKELVREAERETARSDEHRLASTASSSETVREQAEEVTDDADYLDEEAEEEERLLEEMTRGYVMDDFEFNIQSKSALPRKSDSSSNFSGRTYGSSNGSTTITTGTSLSTLAESLLPPAKQTLPPPHPPPAAALPTLPGPGSSSSSTSALVIGPTPATSRPLSFDKLVPGPGVRDRRLSGQNARQLKIETNPRRVSGASTTKPQLSPILPSSIPAPSPAPEAEPADSTEANLPDSSTSATPAPVPLPDPTSTSLPAVESALNESPATPASALAESQASEEAEVAAPPSPARFHHKPMPPPPPPPTTTIRKNFSSSSLKMRNLPVTNAETSDASPITPGSAGFPLTREPSREALPQVPTMPTPTGGSFALHGRGEVSFSLFDDPIHIPQTPGTPSSSRPNAPALLEACPESFLLRPFWLMRCLYQAVGHPRGGYLSTKLFVPSDIWRVKNVKLKIVEDKTSQCDLLTAALLKLAKVDTLDADAVLEEMQSFEAIMEQVRTTLQKKLGNEVGVSGSASLFKNSPVSEEPQGDPLAAKSSNVPAKSYLAGWRKLRSKSSGAGISTSYAPPPSKDTTKDSVTVSTIPMTAQPRTRAAKRNGQQVQGTGPNASYMAALARLFDAVQVLDQIARQVEDPGLKCSSKTHVGLELCTRNAAEFFGFYICRFVLGDIGLMLDKFIKRGSEWALI